MLARRTSFLDTVVCSKAQTGWRWSVETFKLVYGAGKGAQTAKLFDLAKDPGEKDDLVSKMPEKAAEMERKLKELDESCRLSRDGADYRY